MYASDDRNSNSKRGRTSTLPNLRARLFCISVIRSISGRGAGVNMDVESTTYTYLTLYHRNRFYSY
jgi:hypothetical protein